MTGVYQTSALSSSFSGTVRTLILFSLAILVHHVSCKVSSIKNGCIAPEKVTVDFVWGFNRQSHEDYMAFSDEMRKGHMVKLFKVINSVYYGSRFGVFNFGGYKKLECYRRCMGLTRNTTLIQKVLNEPIYQIEKGREAPEAWIAGAYQAVVDNTFGWDFNKPPIRGGRRVIRVMVISADDIPLQSTRNNTLLDGTAPTKYAEYEPLLQLRYVLRKNNIRLITLVYAKETYDAWNRFQNGTLKAHYLSQLDLGMNSRAIIREITNVVGKTLCAKEDTFTETELEALFPITVETTADSDSSSTAVIGVATAAGTLGLLAAVGTVAYKWTGASALPTSATVNEVLENVENNFEAEDREAYAGANAQNFL